MQVIVGLDTLMAYGCPNTVMNHNRKYHLHTDQTVEQIIYDTPLADPKAHKIWKNYALKYGGLP